MLHTILSEIAPILMKASPLLADALGSPIAGMALTLVSNAFGTDPKNPQDLVSKVLENLPDATNKLNDLESQHSSEIKSALNINMPTSIELNVKVNF